MQKHFPLAFHLGSHEMPEVFQVGSLGEDRN